MPRDRFPLASTRVRTRSAARNQATSTCGLDAEGGGEMRLAGADGADECDVSFLVAELAVDEGAYPGLVDAASDVEVVEGEGPREAGLANAGLHRRRLARAQLCRQCRHEHGEGSLAVDLADNLVEGA